MKRKILLVDGYNMIAFWQETRQLFQKSELDAARNILLQKLSHYASFEGIEVICVFDAQYMPGVRQTYEEFNVQVVFTGEDETADDYIERLAAELNTPLHQVSVATSDLNEQWTVFAQGALRVSARELEKPQSSAASGERSKTTHATARSRSIATITRNDGRQVMTFAILTDSTADLDQNWAKEHQVTILGLTIELDGTVYQTVGQGQLTSPELLEAMKNGAKPTTSQVNVGQFQETFEQFAKEGKDLLYVAFSSVLSGTYQSAVMARDLVLEDYPEAVIEIVDPKAAGIGEGYLVMRAVAARDAGRSLAEAKEEIMDLAPKLRTYFLVDDLYHLMRGGRLSKSAAIMGSLASIKPILWIDAEGKLVPISKVRGRKKAVRELLELIKADIGGSTALVSYTNDLEGAEALKQEMLALDGIDEVLVMPLGPVISAHVGPNSLIGFVIGKENRK